MAWDEIHPAGYNPLKPSYSVEKLKANSEERVRNSSGFAILNEAAKRLKKKKDDTVVSLNFDKYVAEQKEYKAETKKMDELDKEIPGTEVFALKADAFQESDTVKVNKNKEWLKSFHSDKYLS